MMKGMTWTKPKIIICDFFYWYSITVTVTIWLFQDFPLAHLFWQQQQLCRQPNNSSDTVRRGAVPTIRRFKSNLELARKTFDARAPFVDPPTNLVVSFWSVLEKIYETWLANCELHLCAVVQVSILSLLLSSCIYQVGNTNQISFFFFSRGNCCSLRICARYNLLAACHVAVNPWEVPSSKEHFVKHVVSNPCGFCVGLKFREWTYVATVAFASSKGKICSWFQLQERFDLWSIQNQLLAKFVYLITRDFKRG